MAEQASGPRVTLQDAEQPLVLVGPPRGIRGEFLLRNATDRKVIVREPRLHQAAEKAAKAKVAAVLPAPATLMRRIIVRPQQNRPVPVVLALDRRTPPGTYHAELDIEGQRRPVVMHVTEDVALTIAPETLVLPNRAGEKVNKRVIFTNDGNVPIAIRSLGTIVLDEELVHCRALRGALADVGETMTSLDDFAAALGRRYRALYETLVLKVQNAAVTVEPGATAAVDLKITLPEKLEPRSRYSGYAAISTTSLTFTIVPE
jgi:hypothetical protein